MAHQIVSDYTKVSENANVKVFVRARPPEAQDEPAEELFERGSEAKDEQIRALRMEIEKLKEFTKKLKSRLAQATGVAIDEMGSSDLGGSQLESLLNGGGGGGFGGRAGGGDTATTQAAVTGAVITNNSRPGSANNLDRSNPRPPRPASARAAARPRM